MVSERTEGERRRNRRMTSTAGIGAAFAVPVILAKLVEVGVPVATLGTIGALIEWILIYTILTKGNGEKS